MQSVNVSLLCRRTKFHCLFEKSFCFNENAAAQNPRPCRRPKVRWILRKKREERFMEVGGGLKIDLEEWG